MIALWTSPLVTSPVGYHRFGDEVSRPMMLCNLVSEEGYRRLWCLRQGLLSIGVTARVDLWKRFSHDNSEFEVILCPRSFGGHRCGISRLRRHHLWPRRELLVLGSPLVASLGVTACVVAGCAVAACDGAFHYRYESSPL